MLAKSHININAANKYGRTALHSACEYGIESHIGAQLLLSDKRCDTNIQDKNGYAALAEAVKWTKSTDDPWAECIKALLSHANIAINQQGKDGKSALHVACGNSIESHVGVQLLLQIGRAHV